MKDSNLKDDYDRTIHFLNSMLEFSFLLFRTLILIPAAVVFALFILALPAIVLLFAFQLPIFASAYVFLVYGGVGAYCVIRFMNGKSFNDDSVDGREVYDDDDHVPTYSSIRKR